MAQNSKIEWTHHTANLWHGCTEVHAGCDNCYARVQNHHWHPENSNWGNNVPRLKIKSVWKDLDKYQRLAKEAGEMHRVFVGSMMDIFEKPMNVVDAKGNQVYCNSSSTWKTNTGLLRDEFFNNIDLQMYENLMFLLLTKRPSNINKYIPEHWKEEPPKNVMFGTSPVDRETAEKLVLQLLEVNGKRFLSIEPQLGPINLYPLLELTKDARTGKPGSAIDWIIQGGESGHHKRPFNLQWAYDMKAHCERANVPYFFKQIDKVQPIPDDLQVRQFPAFTNINI